MRSAELCFKCLRKGHIAKGCKVKCAKCKSNHNVLCCAKNSFGQHSSDKLNSSQPIEHCKSEGVEGKDGAISAELVGITHSALKSKVFMIKHAMSCRQQRSKCITKGAGAL